jgi:hypothetical protein
VPIEDEEERQILLILLRILRITKKNKTLDLSRAL